MKPKTTFEAARDENSINYYTEEQQRCFIAGADFGREFTRTEILSSPELKALIEAIHEQQSIYMRLYGTEEKARAKSLFRLHEKALTNFQAKFGSPTEGEK